MALGRAWGSAGLLWLVLGASCNRSELLGTLGSEPLAEPPTGAAEPEPSAVPPVLPEPASATPAVSGTAGTPNRAGDDALPPNLGGSPAVEPELPAPVIPTLVTALSDPTARDTDPTFTADLLELYFMSTRSGSKDIWHSARMSPDNPWGAPVPVEPLASGFQEENPHVSQDGTTIWFFTDRNRAQSSIWRSTRPDRNAPWGDPEPMVGLRLVDGASDVAVAVDETQSIFILNSKPPGGRPYDFYQVTLGADGILGGPVLLEELTSTVDDFDPDLREGGLFLAFESSRSGVPQIFWTRRQSLDALFDEPVVVPALEFEPDASAPAFSDDLGYVMFSSDRTGDAEIYEARLAP